jgi:hypothetical protein
MASMLAKLLLRLLFLPAPRLEMNDAKRQRFDALIESLGDSLDVAVEYDLPYPKHEFLRYLATRSSVLFHGSNELNVKTLEPQATTDFSGRPTSAVLATGDPVWATFFAVLDWKRCRGSVRNGGFSTGHGKADRFYFFSVNRDTREPPWLTG